MTEPHEVEGMIDSVQEVLDDLRYEAEASPGHGPEFVAKLRSAQSKLSLALDSLREARALLP